MTGGQKPELTICVGRRVGLCPPSVLHASAVLEGVLAACLERRDRAPLDIGMRPRARSVIFRVSSGKPVMGIPRIDVDTFTK
jgi:hypothetical protein